MKFSDAILISDVPPQSETDSHLLIVPGRPGLIGRVPEVARGEILQRWAERLPVGARLTDADVDSVIEAVEDCVARPR